MTPKQSRETAQSLLLALGDKAPAELREALAAQPRSTSNPRRDRQVGRGPCPFTLESEVRTCNRQPNAAIVSLTAMRQYVRAEARSRTTENNEGAAMHGTLLSAAGRAALVDWLNDERWEHWLSIAGEPTKRIRLDRSLGEWEFSADGPSLWLGVLAYDDLLPFCGGQREAN
jgi:hypothetical protein